MKRIAGVAIIALCIFLATPVFAITHNYFYSYSGSYISGSGLDHQKYDSWGRNSSQIPQDEDIVSVTILFKGLYNWDNQENHLFVSVPDDGATPLSFQAMSGEGNAFMYDFALPYSPGNNATTDGDVSYTFTNGSQPSLINLFHTAIGHGNFWLGFDPDSNFWSSKAKLTITTEPGGGDNTEGTPVPEPSTFLLLGAGLAGIGLLRSRFKK